jgi:Ca2+-binding EF-hand superfamily protein
MMHNASALLIVGLATTGWSLWAAEPDLSKLPPPSDKKGLTYAKDIHPILEASCFRCHGEERQRGKLRLDSLEAALKGSENGKVITLGKSKESLLVVAVAQLDDDTAMPPKRQPGGPGGRGGFGPGMMVAPQMLSQGDKNADQKLSKPEITALADAWFDKLDTEKTGKLGQDQFTERLGTVLPPPQGFGRRDGAGPSGGPSPGGGRGGFGPGRFIGPGLFTAADTDKDGSLTRAELKGTFAKWFSEWDTEKSGALTEDKLRDGLTSALPRPNFGGPGGPGGRGPGGQGGPGAGRGPGGPGGPGGGGFGPAPKPLTPEQVGLIRAWIDQGAR